jgi:GNAT superfamily N-acetyltransferase
MPQTAVNIRELEERDVAEASAVFLTTLGDLARRNGLPPPPWRASGVEPLVRHLRATGDFWVAEQEGRIVAICSALLRDDTWFLSLFWTLPEVQGQGVGGPLLRRVYGIGRDRGARRAFTWSSIDPAAIGTYLKLGMLPLCQIFTFGGTVSRLPDLPVGVTVEAGDDQIAVLDREVRRVSREVDHTWWRSTGATPFHVNRDGRIIGWFYVLDGVIGPGGWTDPGDGPAVMALAVHEAVRQSPTVRWVAVGVNHHAIRAAIDAGLRVVGTAHLLQSEGIGAVDRYLPSGPALF